MEIKEFHVQDLAGLIRLINQLHPKWFDKQAVRNIPVDISFQKCFIAKDKEQIVGFISIVSQDGKPYIGWFGVVPNLHRQGIGKLLLEQVERELKKTNAEDLRVKTVIEQDPLDGSYDNTIKFYTALGFKLEEKFEIQKYKHYKFRMGILKKPIAPK